MPLVTVTVTNRPYLTDSVYWNDITWTTLKLLDWLIDMLTCLAVYVYMDVVILEVLKTVDLI